MKYFVIAGEASGDLHGSNLVKELKHLDSDAHVTGWGGDLMEAQGCTITKHYRDLAFMGFVEVVKNIRTISRNFKICKEEILNFQPDALILIDYPGFNLRMAKFAKEHNIPVHYYISPQVWAWKQSRVKKIKRDVDELYCILPFEKDFYQQFDYPVHYVGHPLLDAIKDLSDHSISFKKQHNLDERPVIALLPGSRKQEINTMLPIMLSVIDQFPHYQFVVGGAPSKTADFYSPILQGKAKLVLNQTYDLLQVSEAALVTSGTATLETALFQVPEVVCYKGNWFSYQIAKRLVKVNYISLVNLIMDREVVKELIQAELNTEQLQFELAAILPQGSKQASLEKEYAQLKEKLGGGGASSRVAALIYNKTQS